MTCAEGAFLRHFAKSTPWHGRPDTQSHVRLHLPTQGNGCGEVAHGVARRHGVWKRDGEKLGRGGPTYISSRAMAELRLLSSLPCTFGSTI